MPFQKGNNANPDGRPKLDATARDLQRILLEDFIFFTTDVAKKSQDDVQKIYDDPKEQMLKKVIASTFLKAYKMGEPSRLIPILERAIGKVREVHQIDINASEMEFENKIKSMSVPELQTYANELITKISEVTNEKSN